MSREKKQRILIVGEVSHVVYKPFSMILKKKFHVKEWYILTNLIDTPFFLIRWLTVIRKFGKIIKKFRPNKILICSGPLISVWLIIFLVKLFRLKIEIILFRYDIEYFRPPLSQKGLKRRLGHFVTQKLEKFCLLKADKIIHKGLENELEFLPFYKKIRNKPNYLFREFLNPGLIQKYNPKIKLSKQDGEFHLVIAGSIPLENSSGSDSIWEFYPKITSQKIHLHIYMRVNKQIENELKRIEFRNRYFHYGGYLRYKNLMKEIAKYDYGLYLTSWNRGNIKYNYAVSTAIGHRLFDCISAHLPIVSSDDSTSVVNLIDKYKIGFHIPYRKIYSLKKLLINNKKNYLKTIKNIDEAITHLLDNKNFIKFISSGVFKNKI